MYKLSITNQSICYVETGGGTDRRGVAEDRWRRVVGWTSELQSKRAAAEGQHTTVRARGGGRQQLSETRGMEEH
jgi:hypothetical protein